MIYTIINSHQHKDNDTGMIKVTQGISARFTNNAPGQVAQWDPNRLIETYVRNEITSGRIDPDEEDKKKEWLEGVIKRFVEKHSDFNNSIVWKAPTKEDIKKGLEERKQRLEEEIKSLEEVEVTDEDVSKAVDAAGKEVNPKTKKMVYGGGVTTGGSSTVNKR